MTSVLCSHGLCWEKSKVSSRPSTSHYRTITNKGVLDMRFILEIWREQECCQFNVWDSQVCTGLQVGGWEPNIWVISAVSSRVSYWSQDFNSGISHEGCRYPNKCLNHQVKCPSLFIATISYWESHQIIHKQKLIELLKQTPMIWIRAWGVLSQSQEEAGFPGLVCLTPSSLCLTTIRYSIYLWGLDLMGNKEGKTFCLFSLSLNTLTFLWCENIIFIIKTDI